MTTADVVGPDRPAQLEEEEIPDGFAGLYQRAWLNLRTGNLGPAPIIVGQILVVIIFGLTATNFFTAVNFVNLITETAGTAMLAYGVVFVLLLGEIDLSIGYVAGIGALIVAELQLPGSGWQINGLLAMIIAVLACAVIGMFQGSIVAFVGVPSFVVTLGGFLIWQGVILNKLEQRGTIIIQDRWINYTDAYIFSHWLGWIIAAIITALYPISILYKLVVARGTQIAQQNWAIVAVEGPRDRASRRSARSRSQPRQDHLTPEGLPLAGVLIVIFFVVLTFLAKWTTFGRHVYAVGGNAEAARRAGINVPRIRVIVFMISSATAASRRHHPRRAGELGRPDLPAGQPAAERDRVSGHRRRQPLRRTRRGPRRAARRTADRHAAERPQHAERLERLDLHHHGPHPPRRRHARHDRAAPAGALRALARAGQRRGRACGRRPRPPASRSPSATRRGVPRARTCAR